MSLLDVVELSALRRARQIRPRHGREPPIATISRAGSPAALQRHSGTPVRPVSPRKPPKALRRGSARRRPWRRAAAIRGVCERFSGRGAGSGAGNCGADRGRARGAFAEFGERLLGRSSRFRGADDALAASGARPGRAGSPAAFASPAGDRGSSLDRRVGV